MLLSQAKSTEGFENKMCLSELFRFVVYRAKCKCNPSVIDLFLIFMEQDIKTSGTQSSSFDRVGGNCNNILAATTFTNAIN